MLTDAVLVDRVIAGFDDAFDELYRRHANAAWRLGQAVTGNAHDAADAVSEAFARVLQAVRDGRLDDGAAFRSYLLTATRNAALDVLRRQGRTETADHEQLEDASPASIPADRVSEAADAVIVAQAFRNLPERWRSVLWLTEVEGVPTKDAAEQLGISANGAAQLAVRARAGLRERYLQAHVRNHARPECRFTVEHLGAYVGGGISPRDLAKVDQHLAACADCRDRKEELEDLGAGLRRIVLPIPLALGALSAGKVHAVLTASSATTPAGIATRALQLAKEPTPLVRKLVGSSAAGVLAIGVLSLGVVGGTDDRAAGLAAPPTSPRPVSLDTPEPAIVDDLPERITPFTDRVAAGAPPARQTFGGPASTDAPATGAPATSDPAPAPSAPSAPPAATRPESTSPLPSPIPAPLTDTLCTLAIVDGVCGGTDDAETEDDAEAAPLPTVEAGANLADQTVAVSVDAAETEVGAVVNDTTIVEPAPEPPAEEGVAVTVGDTTISLP